jgi:3'(2'), 5'-bisphosphate nucleotidase
VFTIYIRQGWFHLTDLNQGLLNTIKIIAEDAGRAIMNIYQNEDVEIHEKCDYSPLTQADLVSHSIITQALNNLTPEVMVLSEEGELFEDDIHTFWCVDPLDGTKEFIKKNGEFTVNIALIEHHKPVLGVIHAPVINETFMAIKDEGAVKIKNNQTFKLPKQKNKLRQPPIFAISRSHPNKATQDFIKQYHAETIEVGSSLKLTMLSEGLADAYPRFGRTSLWDTAAGHAILKETAGEVYTLGYQPLTYNIKQILNPEFIAVIHKDMRLDMERRDES